MAKVTLPPGEKGQFAVIPDGVYRMQVQNPQLAFARGSGAPTIECYLAVLEGAKTGERLYHQYSLQNDALWRVRDDLRTCGRIKTASDQPLDIEDTEIARLLNGMTGHAEIYTDTFKGAPRSKLTSNGFLTPKELAERGINVTAEASFQPATAQAPTQAPRQQYPEAKEPF